MSADFSQDILQFNALPTSDTFIPQPLLGTKHTPPYFEIPKADDLIPASGVEVSSLPPLIGSNETGSTLDYLSLNDVSKLGFPPQLQAEVPLTRNSNLPNSNLNLRYRNMLNFPKYLHKKSLAFEKRIKRSGINTDPVCALTLLQRFIQPFVNREIDAIIKKYSKDILSIAIENIRYNLGENAVSENELQHLQYSIMKDAAAQYRVAGVGSPSPESAVASTVSVPCASTNFPSPTNPSAGSVAAAGDSRRSIMLRSSTRHLRRRTTSSGVSSGSARASWPLPEHVGLMILPDANDDTSLAPPSLSESGEMVDDGTFEGRSTQAKKKRRYIGKTESLQVGFLDSGTPRNGSPITDVDPSAADTLASLELELPDIANHDQASSTASDAASNVTVHSHTVPHPPPHLLATDSFTLGSCANAWLGLRAVRGRIYSKHPWIFRYACDREDKLWLSRMGHLPNCGAKAFLVLAKQIHEVAAMEEGLSATRQPLPQFTLPSWLFQKVLNSAATQTRTPRVPAMGAAGLTCNRPSLKNSSKDHQLHSPGPTIVDRFAFTERVEEEAHCHPDFFTDNGRQLPWPSGGRNLPPLRNGHSHSAQTDAAYKPGPQSEASLKVGHL